MIPFKHKVSACFCLLISLTVFAQSPEEKYSKDVESIDAIINAWYDAFSGGAEDPWQYERDKFLHSENALITFVDERGNASNNSLESLYIPLLLQPRKAAYEIELKRKVSKYGHLALVWTAFEVRTNPEEPSEVRGLNSVQLHFENGRWFIDSWMVQMDSKDHPVVQEFLDAD